MIDAHEQQGWQWANNLNISVYKIGHCNVASSMFTRCSFHFSSQIAWPDHLMNTMKVWGKLKSEKSQSEKGREVVLS